jgi:hypothetical protein
MYLLLFLELFYLGDHVDFKAEIKWLDNNNTVYIVKILYINNKKVHHKT